MSGLSATSRPAHEDREHAYFNEVGRIKWLTRDHEREIFNRIDQGRHRALRAISRSPSAIAEVLKLGAALSQRRLSSADLSQRFGRERGLGRGVVAAEMLRQFDRLAGAAPGEVLPQLEALRLDLRPLARIAEVLQRRSDPHEDTTETPEGLAAAIRKIRLGMRVAIGARNELLEGCQRQVVYLARRSLRTGVELMDLIQEGNLGLMIAAEKFEVRRGYRFYTYAQWWIFQGISRAILRKTGLVRLPAHIQESIGRVNRVRRSLTQSQGREPGDHEIAKSLGLSVDAVRELLAVKSTTCVPLDDPLGGDDSSGARNGDSHDDAPSPLSILVRRSMEASVRESLSVLTPREQRIINCRFGLGNHEEHTLAELGKELSLTRERIRQILNGALVRLRRRDHDGILSEFASV